MIAVSLRARAQACKVRSRIRLGEALAPYGLSGGHLGDVALLLRGGSETHQRRPDPVHIHVLRAARLAGGPHLLAQYEVLPGGAVRAAPFCRPVRDQKAGLGQPGAEREAEFGLFARTRTVTGNLIPVRRQLALQERAYPRAIGPILLGPVEVHRRLHIAHFVGLFLEVEFGGDWNPVARLSRNTRSFRIDGPGWRS